MSLTLHYLSKPGYSITESILFAEKNYWKSLKSPKYVRKLMEKYG